MKKLRIPKDGRETYGSHMEFTAEILKELKAKYKKLEVIEFGCGRFSTWIFLNEPAVERLVSIEMQDADYKNSLMQEYLEIHGNENPQIRWYPRFGYDLIATLKHANTDSINPVLCFVDGHFDTRPDCVNWAISKEIPVIMAHDFQYPGYKWERIAHTSDYEKIIKTRPDGQQTLILKLK